MYKKQLIIITFVLLLGITLVLNIGIGAYSLPVQQLFDVLMYPQQYKIEHEVLLNIRIPRVITGVLVGIALAISGVLLQTMFKNPLADPSIIGVSAGASAGVVLFMMASSLLPQISSSQVMSSLGIPLSAFLGSITTIFIIYKLSLLYNKIVVSVMLLSGIAINAFLGALVGIFSYFSTDEELKSFTFWSMGSLAYANWQAIGVLSLVVVVTSWMAWSKREELNLLLLGEDEAKNAGANTEKLKKIFILIVALAVGTTVAYCGIIGFIGLAVPHLARLLVGANHKYLLVLTVLLSPLILLWADAIARVIIRPSELPIGIITSLMGAPFFLWLLLKNKQTIAS